MAFTAWAINVNVKNLRLKCSRLRLTGKLVFPVVLLKYYNINATVIPKQYYTIIWFITVSLGTRVDYARSVRQWTLVTRGLYYVWSKCLPYIRLLYYTARTSRLLTSYSYIKKKKIHTAWLYYKVLTELRVHHAPVYYEKLQRIGTTW